MNGDDIVFTLAGLVRGGVTGGVTVYEHAAPKDAAGRYVIVSTMPGVASGTVLCGGFDDLSRRVWVRCVVSNRGRDQADGRVRAARECQRLAEDAQSAVLGWVPPVTATIEMLASQPPELDDSVQGWDVCASSDVFEVAHERALV